MTVPSDSPEQRLRDAVDSLQANARRARAAAARITPQQALSARRMAYGAAARATSPEQAERMRDLGDGIVSRHPPFSGAWPSLPADE